MLQTIELPKDFKHEPFFSKKEHFISNLSGESIEAVLKNNPFFYDICVKVNIGTAISPWTNSAKYVPLLLKEWNAVQLKNKKPISSESKKGG